MVRKPEKGTGPKIFYLGAEESAIRPEAGGAPAVLPRRASPPAAAGIAATRTRLRRPHRASITTCPHGKPWGIDMVLYLFMKAVSTGAMMLGAILWLLGHDGALVTIAAPAISTVFIALTSVGPGDRSRASRAVLLHPHAPELAIVDGVGCVVPGGPRRHQRLVAGCGLVRLDGMYLRCWRAGDRLRGCSRRPTRASCSRKGWAAISGRARTRRST